MFNEIGKKIKGLASVIAWIGIIASAIMGFITMELSFFTGLLIIAIGALASWVGSFLLYGFGELVDNSTVIAFQLMVHKEEGSTKQRKQASDEEIADKNLREAKRRAMQELRDNMFITEEEYTEALKK
ncbi:MAG: hypothetical protein IJZ08_00285 [Clostridia bacterium]|nr:hypothetical protein [Clostridia bacterium]